MKELNYWEILYDNETEKQEFFDRLIPLLEDIRPKRKSRREFAERYCQQVIATFWNMAVKDMIMENRTLRIAGKGEATIRIARVPLRNNPTVSKFVNRSRKYIPFFVWNRSKSTRVRMKLGDQFGKMLYREVKKGHVYKFGKPKSHGT